MFSTDLQKYALEKYQGRKKYYDFIWNDIERSLAECSEDETVLMQFLYGTMPVRDAGEYPFAIFLKYVQHSLWLRENVEWCKELPEDIFVHHVLYYRINTEDISDCRKFFYEQIKGRIHGMGLQEAVIEINYWCAENGVYEVTDDRTVSPLTMFRCGKGRCGEESSFAVTAYRSVGIPARQVYTPRWGHCDDNHAWVEVYIHGKWYFLGACEPEEVLNTGWFTVPANRALLIHSRTFSDFMVNSSKECIIKENLLTYYNNTSFYAKTKTLTVVVKDNMGNAVEGACVAVEILNMAEYFPAVTLTTDRNGEVNVEIGIGDVRIRAWKDVFFGEKKVSLKHTEKVEVLLEYSKEQLDWVRDEWEQEQLSAPEECPIYLTQESQEQKERKELRLKEASQRRECRFRDCYDEELASMYPEEEEYFRISGENVEELHTFLCKDENPNRRRMFQGLSRKDYKDLKACILEDHLECNGEGLTDEIYEKYLLCPRVFNEELTPYRSFIRDYFVEEKEIFVKDPEQIWKYIKENIHYNVEVDYRTICATPIGCLKMKQGNPVAQNILFVAICRSLNIPARLNAVTRVPEYYKAGTFIGLQDFSEGTKTSSLILKVKEGNKWNYSQTWTIGKFRETGFDTLDYTGSVFENNELELSLESGIYRLITVVRLPDGGQHTEQRVFCLAKGEEKIIEMELWEYKAKELLVDYAVSDFEIQNPLGNNCMISELVAGQPIVLAFLGVGGEPTEHVLNELLASASHWKEGKARMIIILRDTSELKNATLNKVLETLPKIEVYYDQNKCSEKVADNMQVETDKLPLLVILQTEMTGKYACAGYNVGSVELILKLLES